MTQIERTEVEHTVEERAVTETYCDVCGSASGTNQESITVAGETYHVHPDCAEDVLSASPHTHAEEQRNEITLVPPVLVAMWERLQTGAVTRFLLDGVLSNLVALSWPVTGLWLASHLIDDGSVLKGYVLGLMIFGGACAVWFLPAVFLLVGVPSGEPDMLAWGVIASVVAFLFLPSLLWLGGDRGVRR